MPADPARDEACPAFDPEYDAPLFYCCVCARELRKSSCGKCGTEDNTASNWIPNGKMQRPAPAAPPPEGEWVPRAQRERERSVLDAADAYVHAKGAPERARTGIALGEAVAALRGKGGE